MTDEVLSGRQNEAGRRQGIGRAEQSNRVCNLEPSNGRKPLSYLGLIKGGRSIARI